MVDSLDSGSSVHCGRAGSSPASPTKKEDIRLDVFFSTLCCEMVTPFMCTQKKMNGRYQVGSGRIVAVTHDTPFIKNIVINMRSVVNVNMRYKGKSGASQRRTVGFIGFLGTFCGRKAWRDRLHWFPGNGDSN